MAVVALSSLGRHRLYRGKIPAGVHYKVADPHMHSDEVDGTLSVPRIIELALEKRIHMVGFASHNSQAASLEAANYVRNHNLENDIEVPLCAEVSSKDGHLIVVGGDEGDIIRGRSAEETIETAHAEGRAVLGVHIGQRFVSSLSFKKFREIQSNRDSGRHLDGVETLNAAAELLDTDPVARLAYGKNSNRRLHTYIASNKITTSEVGATDGHEDTIGLGVTVYWGETFVESLRTGKVAVAYDPVIHDLAFARATTRKMIPSGLKYWAHIMKKNINDLFNKKRTI